MKNKPRNMILCAIVGGCLVILLGIAIISIYFCRENHLTESPLYLSVSAYQTGTQGWEHPEGITYEDDSGEGLFLQGMDAFDNEDYAPARRLFEQAIAAPGADPALPSYLYYYLNQCDVYLSGTGNPETVSLALDAFRGYAPIYNDTKLLWSLISTIALSTGDDAQAIALIAGQIAKADHHMELSTWAFLKNCISALHYNNREYAKSIRGFYDVELAAESAEMTPELKLEYLYAKEFIANIYYIFEDYEAAVVQYQELIDLSATEGSFDAYGCCTNMATAYLEMSDTENARQTIQTLESYLPRVDAAAVPEIKACMNDTLAQACIMDGDSAGAEEYLNEVDMFYRENTGTIFMGGEFFTQLTRCKYLILTGALDDAQSALEGMLESGDAIYYGMEKDIYELLRDIYKTTGQSEKLTLAYEKLLEADTDFSMTVQREYLEFSKYYKDTNELTEITYRLSRTNLIVTFAIVISLIILVFVLLLLRMSGRKNVTDQLTGVYNRKKLNQYLRNYGRGGTPANLGVVMMDIDYFKRYNDTYGHPAGDEVLKQVAKTLVSSLRSKDVVIRYGGEEFLVLLHDVQDRIAKEACARIHESLRKQAIPHAASEAAEHVTLSMGLCYQENANSEPLNKLIEIADGCLYRSKEEGRNRTTVTTVSECSNEITHANSND